MLARSRREILTTTIFATALTVVQPSQGRSQGISILLELPWGQILGGVASAVVIIEGLGKYLSVQSPSSAKPAPICKISLEAFRALYFRCQTLAVSLESLNYEPVIKNGNEGAIPALSAYQQQPDLEHWKRARDALAQLLLIVQAVLADVARITGPKMDWSSVDVPVPANDVQTVTRALNTIDPTLSHFVEFDEKPDGKVSSGDVQHLLDLLTPLPERVADALETIRSLEKTRQTVTCT